MSPLLNASTITLYGTVGADVFGDDAFTAKDVRTALDLHGPGDLTVHLNSGGGLAFEGLAIFNALKQHPGQVKVVKRLEIDPDGKIIVVAANGKDDPASPETQQSRERIVL